MSAGTDLRLADLPHDHQQCQNCGGHVSTAYRRVFGAEIGGEDVIFGCQDCCERYTPGSDIADPSVLDGEEVSA